MDKLVLDIEELENRICELVNLSLQNKQYSEKISFLLPEKVVIKIKKKIYIDLQNFICVIHSDEIRHIQKEHGNEVFHICKIYHYLEKFAKVEKSSTRDRITGKNIPCLVFIKKATLKDIKIVKMNLSKDKVLRLKTMFEA